MFHFTADIQIIGINPYVSVPEQILLAVFEQANKDRGAIPIRGTINGCAYKQTLVRFKGQWRLYINTTMLKNSPKRIGDHIEISIEFDPIKRSIEPHPKLMKALQNHPKANEVFHNLRPSLQHEIIRYIAALKTEVSVDNNIPKAINFLLGKGKFVGREKP